MSFQISSEDAQFNLQMLADHDLKNLCVNGDRLEEGKGSFQQLRNLVDQTLSFAKEVDERDPIFFKVDTIDESKLFNAGMLLGKVNAIFNDIFYDISVREKIDFSLVPEEPFEGTLIESIQEGNFGYIKYVINQKKYSFEELGKSVQIASSENRLNILRFLFLEGRAISEEDLGVAVYEASRNDYLAAVRILLSENRSLSKSHLVDAVEIAYENRFLSTANYLLSNTRSTLGEDLESIARFSSEDDDLLVVLFLLSNGKQVSKKDLGYALFEACEKGYLNEVRFIFLDGRDSKISSENLSFALLCAAQEGHLEIVRFLISDGRGLKISEQDYNEAFLEAAQNGHLETVKFLLLENEIISEESLEDAFQKASESGHKLVVQFLLDHWNFSDYIITGAIIDASSNGHLDVLQFLLSEGRNKRISKDDYKRAFLRASKGTHIDILRFFLLERKNSRIPKINLEEILLDVACQDNLEVIHLLHKNEQSIEISEECIINAISKSFLGSSREVDFALVLFGQETEFSKEYLRKAIKLDQRITSLYTFRCLISGVCAVSSCHLDFRWVLKSASEEGQIDVVQALFIKDRNKKFSGKDLYEAAGLAAYKGHIEIVRFLLSDGRDEKMDAYKEFFDRDKTSGVSRGFLFILERASSGGDLEVFKFLLEKKSLSIGDLENCVQSACAYGHLKIIEYLLNDWAASKVFKDPIVKIGLRSGNKDIAHFLSSIEEIS